MTTVVAGRLYGRCKNRRSLRPSLMLDDRTIRAARNNAEWCDAVCRAHGNPGEFHEGLWLSRHRVPRFYPNAVTFAEPGQRQLELIDELIASGLPPGWAVKDSFSMLDLESRGFQVLFTAEWIYLAVSALRDIAATVKVDRWEAVRSDRALAEWESAWSMAGGDVGPEENFRAFATCRPGHCFGRMLSRRPHHRGRDRKSQRRRRGMVELLCARG
jgi:hypothetical protein